MIKGAIGLDPSKCGVSQRPIQAVNMADWLITTRHSSRPLMSEHSEICNTRYCLNYTTFLQNCCLPQHIRNGSVSSFHLITLPPITPYRRPLQNFNHLRMYPTLCQSISCTKKGSPQKMQCDTLVVLKEKAGINFSALLLHYTPCSKHRFTTLKVRRAYIGTASPQAHIIPDYLKHQGLWLVACLGACTGLSPLQKRQRPRCHAIGSQHQQRQGCSPCYRPNKNRSLQPGPSTTGQQAHYIPIKRIHPLRSSPP